MTQVAAYAFDGVGNLLRTPHELPGYTDPTRFTRAYNALNQWVGYNDSQDGPNGPVHNTVDNLPGGDPLFAYDGNGNPTRYKGVTCSYDAQNHLTAYGTAMTAGYRGDGLRAWKESGGVRTYFLYVGTTLLCEVDAGGTVTAYNTWGPTGLLARTRPGAHEETWYQFDLQGDVAQRLAADGRVCSTDRYDAWGNAQQGSDTADPYGYKAQVGYYRDAETGLYLCTWRYYDPQAGRWLTEDPIGYAGGMNVYGYCGNDPWGMVDQFGLRSASLTSDEDDVVFWMLSCLEFAMNGSDMAATTDVIVYSGVWPLPPVTSYSSQSSMTLRLADVQAFRADRSRIRIWCSPNDADEYGRISGRIYLHPDRHAQLAGRKDLREVLRVIIHELLHRSNGLAMDVYGWQYIEDYDMDFETSVVTKLSEQIMKNVEASLVAKGRQDVVNALKGKTNGRLPGVNMMYIGPAPAPRSTIPWFLPF